MPEIVSVVIPTYHRPEMLELAVRSVLSQELDSGWELEIIVAVSDRQSSSDLAGAQRLASDPRIRVVVAEKPGPGIARNTALRVARGRVIAFTDDDCVARPNWLKLSLAAIASADIGQGGAVPAGPVPPLGHSLVVVPPSWQWETCNLVVSREAIDRAGLFDENWNPTGRVGDHYGEDLEWGWRLLRAGARPAFVPEALVEHAVTERGLMDMLRYDMKMRHFPEMLRTVPETRRHFFLGYFVSPRHAVLTLTTGLLAFSAAAQLRGDRRAAQSGVALALVIWSFPAHPYLTWLLRLAVPVPRSDMHTLAANPPLPSHPGQYLGGFASRRHAVFAASIGLAAASAIAGGSGRRRTSAVLAGASLVGWLAPMRTQKGVVAEMFTNLGILAARESVQFFPLVSESLRRRRLLL